MINIGHHGGEERCGALVVYIAYILGVRKLLKTFMTSKLVEEE